MKGDINCQIEAAIVSDTNDQKPFNESFIRYYNSADKETKYATSYIVGVPNGRFNILVRNPDPEEHRMGVIVFVDDVEQNRIGVRPTMYVLLSGRPVSNKQEQKFIFKSTELPDGTTAVGTGNIRIELWRSEVIAIEDGAISYSQLPGQAEEPSKNEITKVSRVKYLDKKPKYVFMFQYRSQASLDSIAVNSDIPPIIPAVLDEQVVVTPNGLQRINKQPTLDDIIKNNFVDGIIRYITNDLVESRRMIRAIGEKRGWQYVGDIVHNETGGEQQETKRRRS